MAARPAQGHNSTPRKPPKWAPKVQAAPPVVSSGSVSRPSKPAPWRPKAQAAPTIRQS